MRCGRPRVAPFSLRHGLLLSDARPPVDLRVVHRCPGDRGVALLLILTTLLLVDSAMPHRWSPLKLAARRELARNHGYLRSCPKGHSHVLAPDCVAERVKGVTRGLLATRELERASGLHRRSGADLAVAARPLVGDAMTDAFISENQRYCGHKHRKFTTSDPELEYNHVLPPSRNWCDLSEDVRDADLELDLEEKFPDLPLLPDPELVTHEPDPVHDPEHELQHVFALEHEHNENPPPSMWLPSACPQCCWFPTLAGQLQATICSMSSLIEGQNNTIAILCARADPASSRPAAPLPHYDSAAIRDNISNINEELALRITNLEARGSSDLDSLVQGLSVAVASQKMYIAETQDDITRIATLVKDVSTSLDMRLTMLTAKTMPMLAEKVFEKAVSLFGLADSRIKTLEASAAASASSAHDDWIADRLAGLDSRLRGLESSLLNLFGDPGDGVSPPPSNAEATHVDEVFFGGQYVRLTGLSSVHLNGTIGCIVGFDEQSLRYQVQYAGKPPVKIKGSNLVVASCPKCYLTLNSDVCFQCGHGASPTSSDDDQSAPLVSGPAKQSRPLGRSPTSVRQSSRCVAARPELAKLG